MATHTYKISIEADMTKLLAQINKLENSMDNIHGPDLQTQQMMAEFKKALMQMKKELNFLKLDNIKLGDIDNGPLEELKKSLKEIDGIIEKINKKSIKLNVDEASKNLEKLEKSFKSIMDLKNKLLGRTSSSTNQTSNLAQNFEKEIELYSKLEKAQENISRLKEEGRIVGENLSIEKLGDELTNVVDDYDEALTKAKQFNQEIKQIKESGEGQERLDGLSQERAKTYADMVMYAQKAKDLLYTIDDREDFDTYNDFADEVDKMIKKALLLEKTIKSSFSSVHKKLTDANIESNELNLNKQNKKNSIPITVEIDSKDLKAKTKLVMGEVTSLKRKIEELEIKLPRLEGVGEIKTQLQELKPELAEFKKLQKQISNATHDINTFKNKSDTQESEPSLKDESNIPEKSTQKLKEQNQELLEMTGILKSISESLQSFFNTNTQAVESNNKLVASLDELIQKYKEVDAAEDDLQDNASNKNASLTKVEESLKGAEAMRSYLQYVIQQIDNSANLPNRTDTFRNALADLKSEADEFLKGTGISENIDDLKTIKNYIDALYSSLERLKGDSRLFSANRKGSVFGEGQVTNINDAKNALIEYGKTLGEVKASSLKVNSKGIVSLDVKSKTGEVIKLKGAIDETNNAIRTTTTVSGGAMSGLDKIVNSFSKIFNNFKNIFSGQMIFNKLDNAFRSGFDFVKELDRQLTTINSTMPTTKNGLAELGAQSIITAKNMGITVDSVTEVAEIYANTQETLEGIMAKSSPTLKLSNASGLSTGTSADIVQGVLLQYKELEGQEEHIVDGIEKISASLKMNFGDGIENMATALRKSGSVAKEAGLILAPNIQKCVYSTYLIAGKALEPCTTI